MRRLPVFWLPLALAVLITSRCAIGIPTRSQLQQIIAMFLFEDELYNDVLSENVILNKYDDLPPLYYEAVKDLKNVDPMVSLLALSTPHSHYSGDNLNLSLTIVGKSITCLMHKRVAFHLALIIGLFRNKKDWVKFQVRSTVFRYTIPFYIDMCSAINRYGLFDKLLSVYDLLSSPDMAEEKEFATNIEKLELELKFLSDVIKSSCVVYEMKEYCSSLNLKNLEDCGNKINDGYVLSAGLDEKIIVATLMENENAILNFFDEMDLLRSTDMDAWKVWLKIPDLPTKEEDFLRTPPPKYRNEVKDSIERDIFIKEQTALEEARAIKALETKNITTSPTESSVDIPVQVITSSTETSEGGTPPADT